DSASGGAIALSADATRLAFLNFVTGAYCIANCSDFSLVSSTVNGTSPYIIAPLQSGNNDWAFVSQGTTHILRHFQSGSIASIATISTGFGGIFGVQLGYVQPNNGTGYAMDWSTSSPTAPVHLYSFNSGGITATIGTF